MKIITSCSARPLSGKVFVPGDKSISHRALLVSALSAGETCISGLLESDDVMVTIRAIQALGSPVCRENNGVWRVFGSGLGALKEPRDILDMGNSGTAARLLFGILATHSITATLTGDNSLRARPMERIMSPLRKFGANFLGAERGSLPLTIVGAASSVPIEYKLPIASAQVKSAILLAALNTPGKTVVIEPIPSRDHTERLLRHFGVEIDVEEISSGGRYISVVGERELKGNDIRVPADISSAAFLIVAALLVPGSTLHLPQVGFNPLRIGLVETLRDMGAKILEYDSADINGEPVMDISLEATPLVGVEVPIERASSMIDEYPILAVAAACASGTTVMRGISELRLKESDRISAMTRGLRVCGVKVREAQDSLTVYGTGESPRGGATIDAENDHRVAMAFLVLGMVSQEPITVTGAETIKTSFPKFVDEMNALGADLRI